MITVTSLRDRPLGCRTYQLHDDVMYEPGIAPSNGEVKYFLYRNQLKVALKHKFGTVGYSYRFRTRSSEEVRASAGSATVRNNWFLQTLRIGCQVFKGKDRKAILKWLKEAE